MNYLAIDRKISKSDFLIKDSKEQVLERMNQKEILDFEAKNQIEKAYEDFFDPKTLIFVSVRTPFTTAFPIKFDFAFNYFDFNQTEEIKIEIIGCFAYGCSLSKLPLGHHCAVICKIESSNSKLLSLLPTDKYFAPFVYLCNKNDFATIKVQFVESRAAFQLDNPQYDFENYKVKHLKFLKDNLLI